MRLLALILTAFLISPAISANDTEEAPRCPECTIQKEDPVAKKCPECSLADDEEAES